MAVLIQAPSFFILPPTLNPPSPVHLKRNIREHEEKSVQMFIFYSFQVPVFCGVIWILTNSFVCRKRAKVDEWIWIFKIKKKKSCITV